MMKLETYKIQLFASYTVRARAIDRNVLPRKMDEKFINQTNLTSIIKFDVRVYMII